MMVNHISNSILLTKVLPIYKLDSLKITRFSVCCLVTIIMYNHVHYEQVNITSEANFLCVNNTGVPQYPLHVHGGESSGTGAFGV